MLGRVLRRTALCQRRSFHSRARVLLADKTNDNNTGTALTAPAAATTEETTPTTSLADDIATVSQFKWQHLVTPYSPPDFSARMRSIENQLANMRAELVGVPSSIKAIDWSDWEEKIQDKEAVKAIREAYEKQEFKAEAIAGQSELETQLDASISKLQQHEEQLKGELAEKKQELIQAKKDKEEVHGWHFHDFLNRYPGLAEQNRQLYMDGYQLPTDAEDRLAEADVGEMRKMLRSGQRVPLDPELPNKFGNFDYLAEMQKLYVWARKLFGDHPKWPEMEKEIQRELAEASGHVDQAQGTEAAAKAAH